MIINWPPVSFNGWISGASVSAFSPGGLALVIVAGFIWFYHYRVSESEGHPSSAAKDLAALVCLYNECFRFWQMAGDKSGFID